MKYKVGDTLKVLCNIHGHDWDIGDTVVVLSIIPLSHTPYKTSRSGDLSDGKFCFVSEDEVEINTTANDKPTGGPSEYYDFPVAETLNDLIENRALSNWGAYGVHLFNIFKACWRWDTKEGTTKLYDARKIVYSGLRLIIMLEGKSEVARYLEELSNDKQFKENKTCGLH